MRPLRRDTVEVVGIVDGNGDCSAHALQKQYEIYMTIIMTAITHHYTSTPFAGL